MNGEHGRGVAMSLDESRTRIQTVAELLLLSCSPRPVFSGSENLQVESYVSFRDKVMAQLNKVLLLTRDISTQVHSQHIQVRQLCCRVKEMSTAVISLSEISAHIAYLMALTFPETGPAIPGPVTAVHQLTAADLDLRFCCSRLKRSRMNDLQPNVLVEMCSSITRSITIMSEVCRQAAEKSPDSNDQDQFKLCVKTITSTTGCLVSSIKSFKHDASEVHLRRVITFCDPVTSASAALLTFASEETFTGQAASLSKDATELYKSVIGLAMSIASASVQICKAARDLAYSSSTKRHRDRISLCVESVTRSAGQLRDFLLSYQFLANGESLQCFAHSSCDSSQTTRSSQAKSRDRKSRNSTTLNKESSLCVKTTDLSNTCKVVSNAAKNGQGDDSPDDHADDSGICDEKSNDVSLTMRDCLVSPQSSSRPSSAIIDKMFSCEEEKTYHGECKSTLENPALMSSTTTLSSLLPESGSGRETNTASNQRLSLGLTTESNLPLDQLTENDFCLKSNDI